MNQTRGAGLLAVAAFLAAGAAVAQKKAEVEYPLHAQADLSVTELAVQPDIPSIGATARVRAIVSNLGETAVARATLVLRAGEALVETSQVERLEPGQKRTVTLSWKPAKAGYVVLSAEARSKGTRERSPDNNRLIKAVAVRGPEIDGAIIQILDVSFSPDSPKVGRPVTARIQVKNAGSKTVTDYPLKIRIGRTSSSLLRLDELAAGATAHVTYSWRMQPGQRDVEVEPALQPSSTAKPPRPGVRPTDTGSSNKKSTAIRQGTPAPDIDISDAALVELGTRSVGGETQLVYSYYYRLTNASETDIPGAFTTRTTFSVGRGTPPSPLEFRVVGLKAGKTVYHQVTVESRYSLDQVDHQADSREEVIENDERNNHATVYPGATFVGPVKVIPGSSYYKEAAGKLETLEFDCEDPRHMYASASRCGIWASDDGGSTWGPVGDSLPTMGFPGLAADPFEKGVVYALGLTEGGHGGVFRSETYGSGWREVNEDFETDAGYSRLMANRNKAGEYWATNESGLWKSTDHCRTFVQVLGKGKCDPKMTTGTPLQAAFDGKGEGLILVVMVPPEGSKQATLGRSVDGGKTWSYVTEGFNHLGFAGRLVIHGADSRIVYAAFKDTEQDPHKIHFYKSSDKGAHWAKIQSFQPSEDWAVNEAVDDIATDPDDPDTVFIGGVDLYRYTKAEGKCRAISQIHADQHAIVFHPRDPKIVFVVNDGGIYKSSDRGLNWTAWNHDLPNLEFYDASISTASADFVAGGLQDNGTIMSKGSKTWQEICGGDGGKTIIVPNNDYVIFGTYQYADSLYRLDLQGTHSYRDANAGLPEGGEFVAALDINPKNVRELAAGVESVYLSSDEGLTWKSVFNPGTNPEIMTVTYDEDGSLYVALKDGRVFVSRDAARKDFQKISSAVAFWPKALRPGLKGRVFVCCDQREPWGKVWMISPNEKGGHVTKDITGDLLPEVKPWSIRPSPYDEKTVYLGTYNGLYVGLEQADGHWVWNPHNENLPLAIVADLEVHTPSGQMVVATTGRGVYRLPIRTGRTPSKTATRKEPTSPPVGR